VTVDGGDGDGGDRGHRIGGDRMTGDEQIHGDDRVDGGVDRRTWAIAVIPVRDGTLPIGADEAVAEAGGRALVVGDGTDRAALALQTATDVSCAELGVFAPGSWAASLAPHLQPVALVILPASPDGRDLAPRLAHTLGRPLFAGAISVRVDRVVLARQGGLLTEEHVFDGRPSPPSSPACAASPLSTKPRQCRRSTSTGLQPAVSRRRGHRGPARRPGHHGSE